MYNLYVQWWILYVYVCMLCTVYVIHSALYIALHFCFVCMRLLYKQETIKKFLLPVIENFKNVTHKVRESERKREG